MRTLLLWSWPAAILLAVLALVLLTGSSSSPGSITAIQGTAAAQSSRWPMFLSDGTNPVGTSGNPLRIDPTGSTPQPVSGTVAVSNLFTATAFPTYSFQVTGIAAASNKDLLNVFNASGSGVILWVTRIWVQSAPTATVTGTIMPLEVWKTLSAGATCTSVTASKYDSNDAALPAQVTGGHTCTTDPTLSFQFSGCTMQGDETTAGSQNVMCYDYRGVGAEALVLREGQGVLVNNNLFTQVGNVSVFIEVVKVN